MEQELIRIVETSGLEPHTASMLKDRFVPMFEQAEQWKAKAESLVVTDATQTREMKMAREARLALRDIRLNADKTRKALKEDSTRYGKAVQGMYNVIEYLIVPLEEHLEKQEKFVELHEARIIKDLNDARRSEIDLVGYGAYVPQSVNLGTLSEKEYAATFLAAKTQHDLDVAEAAEIEKARIAEEAEREAQRLENTRLRDEAAKRENELRKEREEAAKLARALQEKEDAERKEQERIDAEERRRLADSDVVKLQRYSAAIQALSENAPTLKDDIYISILNEAKLILSEIANIINSKIELL